MHGVVRRASTKHSITGSQAGSLTPIGRARSSTLRRAGTSVSTELPSTPPTTINACLARAITGDCLPGEASPSRNDGSALQDDATKAALPLPPQEEPCGLTPASLKHLKRQRDSLSDDKARLQTEVSTLQATIKEQRERVTTLEAEAKEFEAREAALRKQWKEACEAEAQQRQRAEEAERRNQELEEQVKAKDAELKRLHSSLEEQRQLTKDVCEATARRVAPKVEKVDNSASIERISQLEAENKRLKERVAQKDAEHEDMQRSVVGAMAAAEKAMAMHACHVLQFEQLRSTKLSEAINQKVELHISVPRVTLSYNNAPPLLISAAAGLGDGKIKEFLATEVFAHFEPLWVRLDKLDKAPDGSSKRAYSTKMLERLTEAVKAFVLKSQQADAPPGSDMSLVSCGSSPVAGGPQRNAGASISQAASAIAESVGRKANSGSEPDAKGGSRDLADADREKLLDLLRSGDDRGLDSKLAQLLASGAR